MIKRNIAIALAIIIGLTFSFGFTTADVSALSKPGIVRIVSVSQYAVYPTVVCIKWKKLSKNTSGYKVYRSTQKSKGYKCIATLKGKSKTKYEDDSLGANGETYYYKVRAYHKKNGKKKYGKYSAVKSVKMPILYVEANVDSKSTTKKIKVTITNNNSDIMYFDMLYIDAFPDCVDWSLEPGVYKLTGVLDNGYSVDITSYSSHYPLCAGETLTFVLEPTSNNNQIPYFDYNTFMLGWGFSYLEQSFLLEWSNADGTKIY